GEVHCEAATNRSEESSGATPLTGIDSLMALGPLDGVVALGCDGCADVPYRASRCSAMSASAATWGLVKADVWCAGSTTWSNVTSCAPGTTANQPEPALPAV